MQDKIIINSTIIIGKPDIVAIMVLDRREWYGKKYKVVHIEKVNEGWYEFRPRGVDPYSLVEELYRKI